MANIEVDLKNYETTAVDVHELIGEAMRKKDRIVLVNITKFGTAVTIQPMSEDAKWIRHGNVKPPLPHFQCSECGQFARTCSTYCPHCGTQLTGVKDVKEEATDDGN